MNRDAQLAYERVSEALTADIQALFRERLQRFGASDVIIVPDEDHDGDPVLRVEVKHTLVDEPVPLEDVLAVDRAARDLAQQKGEPRFLHVRHVFDEKQRLANVR